MTKFKPTQEQLDKIEVYAKEAIEIGLRPTTVPEGVTDPYKILNMPLLAELLAKYRHKILSAEWSYVGEVDVPIQVYPSVKAALDAIDGIDATNSHDGCYDINWLYFYKFFRDECGIKDQKNLTIELLELANHIGLFWLCEDVNIVSLKPISYSFQTRKIADSNRTIKVLHNPNGSAIQWLDGSPHYSIGGIWLRPEDEWIVADPSRKNVQSFLKITNVDLRNEALKTLPGKDLVDQLGGKVIHEADIAVGGNYKLVELSFGDSPKRYLTGSCPSDNETFCQKVPATCQTVQDALLFRNRSVLGGLLKYVPPTTMT